MFRKTCGEILFSYLVSPTYETYFAAVVFNKFFSDDAAAAHQMYTSSRGLAASSWCSDYVSTYMPLTWCSSVHVPLRTSARNSPPLKKMDGENLLVIDHPRMTHCRILLKFDMLCIKGSGGHETVKSHSRSNLHCTQIGHI